ncbi:MAG TPA: outer membrane beta-barrel protein [Candidatus Eisenbacteria bacterium]|nr:outer membrane beta-barrel protein [Candidatus Eisenbacteria bacterium]
MNHRAVWLGLVVFSLSAAVSTCAQGKFEVSPFVGFETSGSYPVSLNSNNPITDPINRLRVNQAMAYGTFLDYNFTENFQAEFMWNRNNTSYSAQSSLDGSYFKAYDSNIDQYQFGGEYMFLDSSHRFRPYAAASIGFTHDSNGGGNSNRTEFSYSLGGGVKYYLSRHLGLRGDVRYLPTYGSSSYGVYCDPFGFCYNAKVANFLNRGNFVGGIIFKF